jgi:hypothetical protein
MRKLPELFAAIFAERENVPLAATSLRALTTAAL